jgi:hypothetical protein
MTVADLEALQQSLADTKQVIAGQLRRVEAELCQVSIALITARNTEVAK